ncbi:microtubule-associated protein RP/EB family member 1 [Octopus vulgaris]|uniref:Microtubule-associated protein RP/EB family member 1 n=1 Tax=Octopus vulgaris TaxID=6645 RepID=A0AA36AU94_OCTVU|nr:microtubule-associated protein RP/EB family member 1 [Octopus vulgaris]
MVRITTLSESFHAKEGSKNEGKSEESYVSFNADWTMMLELSPDVFQTLQTIFQKSFVPKFPSNESFTWRSMVNRIYNRPKGTKIEWNKPKRISSCGRKTLIKWVNDQLQTQLLDIGELSSGIHYCFLLDILAPNIIPKKKIKFEKKAEAYDYNFKLLEKAFYELKIDKLIPKKIKDKNLKEILIFTNWLKSFFEANLNDDLREEFLSNNQVYSSSILSDAYESDTDMLERHDLENSKSQSKAQSQSSVLIPSLNNALIKYGHGDTPEIKCLKPQSRIKHGLETEKCHSAIDPQTTPNFLPRLIKPKRVGMYGRKTLINWIRRTLAVDINDLNQLSDGIVFCLLMNHLDPIVLPRYKIKAKADASGFLQNYRLLQAAFIHHKIDKVIRVNKLIACNMKEILMFTNWLKAFLEYNLDRNEFKSSDSTEDR